MPPHARSTRAGAVLAHISRWWFILEFSSGPCSTWGPSAFSDALYAREWSIRSRTQIQEEVNQKLLVALRKSSGGFEPPPPNIAKVSRARAHFAGAICIDRRGLAYSNGAIEMVSGRFAGHSLYEIQSTGLKITREFLVPVDA
ncbi:hypothetical protein DFH06DRAFT_1128031 [Mycena polygramma]|nr:hypothetical protein DFH06DRAFT_1128031 [Mycena polygramma]